MSEPRILGIDPSLNGTAVVWPDGTPEFIGNPDDLRDMARLIWLRTRMERIIMRAAPHLVLIEGYSFGSKGNSVLQLGEWGGVLRVLCHEMGVDWMVLSPGTVKLVATGSGQASKNAMLLAAVKRLGYEGENGDEADALWVHQAGLQAYGCGVALPKGHLTKLGALPWPELPGFKPLGFAPVLV